jgi:hypothetical protein
MTCIKKARMKFRCPFTSNAKSELKYVVFEISKAISQKFRKGARSCFNSLVHAAASFQRTLSVLTE